MPEKMPIRSEKVARIRKEKFATLRVAVVQKRLIQKLTEDTKKLQEIGVHVSNQQYPFGFA